MSYRGHAVALLTQHGKEAVIAPRFLDRLGARVQVVDGFDTDRLGTFTREIPRSGTQLEAARLKARLGIALTGLPLGVSSEGAFGPDPYGLIPWNVELVLFLDQLRGIEIVGRAAGPARHDHQEVGTWETLEAFARRADFPTHGLVLRPDSQDDPRVTKGIRGFRALHKAFSRVRADAASGVVFVAHDLRAHVHPSRMRRIAEAVADLTSRIESPCPACEAPGFWRVRWLEGRPCLACDVPTHEPRAEIRGCVRCTYEEVREQPGRADPASCGVCNP